MTKRRNRNLEFACVAAFVATQLVAPFVLGDMYPFTLAPMFRDQPQLYCDYQVHDPQGELLKNEDFGLLRVYDGNPRGMGVGIIPPETIDEFGFAPSKQEVIDWVEPYLVDHRAPQYVTVTQIVIGPIGETVGEIERNKIVVTRPGGSK